VDAESAANLAQLHAKVDAFFERVHAAHAAEMQCRAGCSGCCQQSLSLFPIEMDLLIAAVRALPPDLREAAIARAQASAGQIDESFLPCPLLDGDRCIAYAARPTICRSHGIAVLVRDEERGAASVSACPLNFEGGLGELPPRDVLDLDRVNQMVALADMLLARRSARPEGQPARVGLREALRALGSSRQ
jgi:Fe-S-cluster containining protein